MAHNRVRANKNTYDSRAVHRQNRKPPTVPNMGAFAFLHNMSIYSDTPNWKWRGQGKFEYTHDAGAAAYVAECRRREMEKMHKVEQRRIAALTDQQKLARAAARLPQMIPAGG